MQQQIAPISAAQILAQNELYAFYSRDVMDLFELNKFQVSRLLKRMEQLGLVARVERGKFLLLGLNPERVLSNPLFIGCHLVTPAYVSFWSALHFHGLTEQAPLTVFLATTRRKNELGFQEMRFKFVTLKPGAFFGYQRVLLADLPVVVADEAKAILDGLALPQYTGGISEVARALQMAISRNTLDVSDLVDYAARLDNLSLASRLGYLLETLGQPTTGLTISQGPVKLDPHKPIRGLFNHRWQLYINLEHDDLFPQGVV